MLPGGNEIISRESMTMTGIRLSLWLSSKPHNNQYWTFTIIRESVHDRKNQNNSHQTNIPNTAKNIFWKKNLDWLELIKLISLLSTKPCSNLRERIFPKYLRVQIISKSQQNFQIICVSQVVGFVLLLYCQECCLIKRFRSVLFALISKHHTHAWDYDTD